MMAEPRSRKISELGALITPALEDSIAAVDFGASRTREITFEGLFGGMPKTATKIVAASNTPNGPARADYVCDGTDDDVEINAAINSISAVGGSVYLLEGTYNCTDTITMVNRVSLFGQDVWNTRLMFYLTSGVAIDLQGADTDNRKQCSLRDMRIDGTYCTGDVDGVIIDWNQDQLPIMEGVTIYGGYTGATNGFRNGLVFAEDGDNWIVDFRGLAIEGCRVRSLLINNNAALGKINIINFFGCRFENCLGLNLYIQGALQVNFYGCTIEAAGYDEAGTDYEIFIDYGSKVVFDGCWFESYDTTVNTVYVGANTLTYGGVVYSARASFHNCHWAYGNIGVRNYGEVYFSGYNLVYVTSDSVAHDGWALALGSSSVTYITGPSTLLRGVEMINDLADDSTVELYWNQDTLEAKTANDTMVWADVGKVFTNEGAGGAIVLSLPAARKTLKYSFVRTDAHALRIDPNGAEVITGGGAGKYLELDTDGDSVHLQCNASGVWDIMGGYGTYAYEL